MTFRLILLALFLAPAASRAAADLPTLWAERAKCTVAVEYTTETETERQQRISMGTVIDAKGTIIMPSNAVDPQDATWQLKDFKVYLPGDATGSPAEYLGQDAFTGWHFVRASEKVRAQLTPVTAFAAKGAPLAPALADFVWGMGLRNKDEDFAPYLMQSHVALIQSLPQRTAIAQQEVAGPGLPVFNRDGVLLGLASPSFGQTFLQFGRNPRPQQVTLINVEESSAFMLAEEILPYLDRIPKSVSGRPLAWLGAYGLEPMDREVAKFLKLEAQSGAVVSEVLEGSPAEKAGLKDHDIILALDGQPLPQLKPDHVIVSYIEREVDRRAPGDTLALSVLRGADRVELKVVLGEEPKLLREAERKYFENLGFTAREFVYGDAIDRHVKIADSTGVVAHFVKPSSPAATAGLRPDDWIKEIDGTEVKTYAAATAKLAEIDTDKARSEFVLLVGRGGETAVLRVKLKYEAMFTGLVEETGRVVAFTKGAAAWRLQIAAHTALAGTTVGDSVAVNGCCLTVAHLDASHSFFDVLEETRRLTNFFALAVGAPVNLERSLRFDGKVGGHFVTGHIDGLGVVEVFEPRGADHYLRVRAPVGSGRYLIHKGSIAIDGISLTLAEVAGDGFAVWLIPHTLGVTNLRVRRAGESVNLEFDLLGKYVEKLLSIRSL